MTENPEMTAEETVAETPEAPEAKPAKKATAKKAPAKPAKAPAKAKAKSEAAGPDATRGRRKTREGIVVSNRMAKTVVVMVQRRTQHPLYGKVVIRSNKFKAHDEQSCDIGDRVEIMETRPLSRDKRWRVTQILEKVK